MQVQRVPPAAGFVGVDAPRHAEQPGDVHHVERQVEADHEQPEVQLAQPLAQHPAGDFRVPVVERGEEREENAADDHVVEVRHDEVRAG